MFLLFKLEKARSLHYKGHRRLSWVSFCCMPYINAWRMNMYIRSAYAMFHIIDPCIRVTIKKLSQMNEENNKNFKLSDIELIMIWPYRNYNMQLKVLNNVACDEKKNDKDILNRNLVNSFENILDQVSINSPFCIKLEIRTCRSDVASLGRPI